MKKIEERSLHINLKSRLTNEYHPAGNEQYNEKSCVLCSNIIQNRDVSTVNRLKENKHEGMYLAKNKKTKQNKTKNRKKKTQTII